MDSNSGFAFYIKHNKLSGSLVKISRCYTIGSPWHQSRASLLGQIAAPEVVCHAIPSGEIAYYIREEPGRRR